LEIDVDLAITSYRFTDETKENGLCVRDDVHIIFTISNFGFDDFNIGEALQIRQEKDNFFEKNAMLMKGLNVPSTGSTEFSFVMKVQNKIETLNTLPNEVKVEIINRKRDVISSVMVTVPIRLYVIGLKKRYKPINVFLFGQVGMGKSSFVNTVATVFNQNDDYSMYVQRVTAAATSTVSLTQSLTSFTFGYLRLFDTWGWQSEEENSKNSYTEDFFELILHGLVPENTELSYVSELMSDISQLEQGTSNYNKIDVVIFFVTPMETNPEYLKLLQRFQGICGKNKVKTMVLLTQIDIINAEFEKDPYTKNGEPLEELMNKVSNDTQLAKVDIKPIVNYVNTETRTWFLDKACFIPIQHCFMIAEIGEESLIKPL